MKLKLEDIKKMHDKAYEANQTTRERASDDLVFYWITHWDDAVLDESQLAYRGEFDILRKAGRNILTDLEENPVQVDFEPVDDKRQDAADILDGLYRTDNRSNVSMEAFNNADLENVVCGFGAWELYTDYLTRNSDQNLQVIRRRPIYEANNTVFFDPNAKRIDKSDATYVSKLCKYSKDGYLDLVEELTGERPEDIVISDFNTPQQSYTFPWLLGQTEAVYVAEFYHRQKVTQKILTMVNPMGIETTLAEDQLKEVMDDMLDDGFEILSTKEIDRYEVTKYICSGEKILDKSVIAGQHIPIIPEYGERAFVEGEEHYEGITRLAKDPQRLRDFQLSYLADIASKSPREKPIFYPEQVAGHENMYSLSGADNNYPYVLLNRKTPQGEDLPPQQIGTLPAPNIPPALIASIELSRQAVEDVANPGIPQDIADPDLSGKAVLALQARMDKQSLVYQTHRKFARRRDGEVYASMAAEVYDVPREVKTTLPDGTVKTEKIMETVVDKNTGEIVTLKDLNNAEFNVYSEISSSYSSQKDQTIERIDTSIEQLPPGDPMREILLLKKFRLMDGVDFDDVRDYANKKLLILGVRKPESEEDQQILQQEAQKGQQPSAEMVLAMAEDKKGQAALLSEKRAVVQMELDARDKATKAQIEGFKAETGRMDVQIKAQEAGASIDKDKADALNKNIDAQSKLIQMRHPSSLSDDELVSEMLASG